MFRDESGGLSNVPSVETLRKIIRKTNDKTIGKSDE
jgi:hypothetical protein